MSSSGSTPSSRGLSRSGSSRVSSSASGGSDSQQPSRVSSAASSKAPSPSSSRANSRPGTPTCRSGYPHLAPGVPRPDEQGCERTAEQKRLRLAGDSVWGEQRRAGGSEAPNERWDLASVEQRGRSIANGVEDCPSVRTFVADGGSGGITAVGFLVIFGAADCVRGSFTSGQVAAGVEEGWRGQGREEEQGGPAVHARGQLGADG
eukprot:350329-Rhodomonas_salina.3